MKGKRTPYEIYWEILHFCKRPRTFTNIINRCVLNSKIGKEYLEFLISKGYLSKLEEEGRNLYQTSEAADGFLVPFSKMYIELFNKSPEFKL